MVKFIRRANINLIGRRGGLVGTSTLVLARRSVWSVSLGQCEVKSVPSLSLSYRVILGVIAADGDHHFSAD